MRYNSLASERYVIEPDVRFAITGPFVQTPDPIPEWARSRVQAGSGYYQRGSVGWPLRFAVYEAEYRVNGGLDVDGLRRLWIIPITTRPVFAGMVFLVVMLYGVIVAGEWIVLRVPGKLRERKRLRRGLCRTCGYDLSGIDGRACPECGTDRSLSQPVA